MTARSALRLAAERFPHLDHNGTSPAADAQPLRATAATLAEIADADDVVRHLRPGSARLSSYRLKHLAEYIHPGRYVSNGAALVAGIARGLAFDVIAAPNVAFRVSPASRRRVLRLAREKRNRYHCKWGNVD